VQKSRGEGKTGHTVERLGIDVGLARLLAASGVDEGTAARLSFWARQAANAYRP
jgi:hypothetical protein